MTQTRSRTALILGIAGAVFMGVLTATQSRINSELSLGLGDGYLTALISFSLGLVILLVVLAVWRPARHGLAWVFREVRSGGIPWWYLIGGTSGALFVLSQGLTGATLGVALFTVAVVCGQTISGLLIDRSGLGAAQPAPVTVTRLVGSVVALGAVAWAVSGELGHSIPLWMLLLPFIAGLLVSAQQAVNGQVRVVAHSAATATFINFVAGTTVLAIATAIHFAFAPVPTHFPTAPWLYLGGVAGVLFIGLGARVVRVIGVLLLGLASIAGQLVTSLVLDLALPVDGRAVVWTTVAGTLLTLVAVTVAALPSRAIGKVEPPILPPELPEATAPSKTLRD